MAVIRQTCRKEGFNPEEDNFVVAHLGGGISISAIEKGRCIDVSNGLTEGPFTPERSGSLPTIDLVKLCFSGKYTEAQIKKLLVGKGGLVSYLGTSDMVDIANRIRQGDTECEKVFNAMAYQIGKVIGSYVAVLKGKVKRIILTGGGANNTLLIEKIRQYIESFAPIHLVPGEDELAALCQGALRVLRQEATARDYTA
jgi:butyrate kinase